jgi:DNA-binding PadR family transcriptional regulator
MRVNRILARDAEALLPLPLVTFHILVALTGEEMHGYAIMQEVAARTGGPVQLGAGTLYRSIHRMLKHGLVVETTNHPDPRIDDERRRYYRITPLGAAVVRAETERLAGLIALARAKGLGPKGV